MWNDRVARSFPFAAHFVVRLEWSSIYEKPVNPRIYVLARVERTRSILRKKTKQSIDHRSRIIVASERDEFMVHNVSHRLETGTEDGEIWTVVESNVTLNFSQNSA